MVSHSATVCNVHFELCWWLTCCSSLVIGWSGYRFAENLTFRNLQHRHSFGRAGTLKSQDQLSKTSLKWKWIGSWNACNPSHFCSSTFSGYLGSPHLHPPSTGHMLVPPPSNLPLPSNGHMVVEQPVVSAPGRQWAPGFRLGCAAVCALQASAHCVVHPSLALLELCVGSLRLGLFSAEQGAFKGKVNRSNQQIGLPPLWITRNSCWWFLNFSWTFLGKTFY